MRKFVGASAIVLLLCGCANNMPQPRETARFVPHSNFSNTVSLIEKQAEKCWTRTVTAIKWGVEIKSERSTDGTVATVSAWRSLWGGGVTDKPFLIVHIADNSEKATVDVSEGEFAVYIDPTNPYKLDIGDDVEKWLKGDLSCKPFAHTLQHF